MFWTFEAVFKLKNLRKLHISRLRARSVICIKDRQNSQEGGTTFARHVQILPRHRLTNQKRFLCFNQQQITKELGPGFPRALLYVCHAQKRRALGSRMMDIHVTINETCQNKVSADQYHVIILRAQMCSSSRSRVF